MLRKPHIVKACKERPLKCHDAQSLTLTVEIRPPSSESHGKALSTFPSEQRKWLHTASPVYSSLNPED